MEQLQVAGLQVTSCNRCVFYTNRLISSLENVIFVPTRCCWNSFKLQVRRLQVD